LLPGCPLSPAAPGRFVFFFYGRERVPILSICTAQEHRSSRLRNLTGRKSEASVPRNPHQRSCRPPAWLRAVSRPIIELRRRARWRMLSITASVSFILWPNSSTAAAGCQAVPLRVMGSFQSLNRCLAHCLPSSVQLDSDDEPGQGHGAQRRGVPLMPELYMEPPPHSSSVCIGGAMGSCSASVSLHGQIRHALHLTTSGSGWR